MRSSPRLSAGVGVLSGLIAGAVATWAKTQAEDRLQPLAEKLMPPSPAQKIELGADPAGHPENMPPSELADRVVHAASGDDLSDEARRTVSSPIHWTMGIGSGIAYALASRRWPLIRTGRGAVFGAALFAATHASTLPAAGLQNPPSQMPTAWWLWEGGSHLVYGVVLDAVLVAAENVASRRR